MHLVNPLACGIAVAAVGTCILNKRGTATRAQYYKDFEATQAFTAQPIALDSSGSAVLYVNELVDVLVYDAAGILVREFVAGDAAPAVEVISRSFTGVSYQDGSAGTSKPTTLQSVLDLWLGSAGSPDFKVVPTGGGSALTLSAATAALQGLFFNVKTYGAVGNGVADDGVAIAAAIAAAAATSTGGGTVFFPPGTYRTTTAQAVPGGVSLLGSGGSASKLRFDGAAIGLTFNATASLTICREMDIGCQTTNNSANLITIATSGRTHILDCTIGGNSVEDGRVIELDGTAGVNTETVIARCKITSASLSAAQSQLVPTGGAQIVRLMDCDFINLQTRGITHIFAHDGMTIRGCRFDSATANSIATVYIDFGAFGAGSTYEPPEVSGCQFGGNNALVPTALYNSDATPARDFVEYGNKFGGFTGYITTNITPYRYATDGYSPLANTVGFHGTRQAMHQNSSGGAAFTADPKVYGSTTIKQTAGAALALDATLGSIGDIWYLTVINTSGGLLTVTPNVLAIYLDALAATFTVANNVKRMIVFAWVPIAGGVTGKWTQIAQSATA